MAFSFGRQFRRIAAEALTADPDEMRALMQRILPACDSAPPVLRLKSEADCQRAPAVIVAAFFADAITGDEAADLLRKTEDPAFRKQVLQDRENAYALWGPISLTRDSCNPADLPHSDPFPPWGPPIYHLADTPPGVGALVNNKENRSAPAEDAADRIPEHPPP
jgi:hypothetical protein